MQIWWCSREGVVLRCVRKAARSLWAYWLVLLLLQLLLSCGLSMGNQSIHNLCSQVVKSMAQRSKVSNFAVCLDLVSFFFFFCLSLPFFLGYTAVRQHRSLQPQVKVAGIHALCCGLSSFLYCTSQCWIGNRWQSCAPVQIEIWKPVVVKKHLWTLARLQNLT